MTTRPLRVLVADDEALALDRLTRLVSARLDVELVDACCDSAGVLRTIEHEAADVVILDIEMPGLKGTELAELLQMHPDRPGVIFVTAFPEHALRAFDVAALDYVLKPYSRDRLYQSLDRARERLVRDPERATHDPGIFRLATGKEGRLRLLAPAGIEWIEAKLKTSIAHCAENSHALDLSISRVELILPSPPFVRVHRSAIVNLERVVELIELVGGNSELVMRSGQHVSVSRRMRWRLEQLIGGLT